MVGSGSSICGHQDHYAINDAPGNLRSILNVYSSQKVYVWECKSLNMIRINDIVHIFLAMSGKLEIPLHIAVLKRLWEAYPILDNDRVALSYTGSPRSS